MTLPLALTARALVLGAVLLAQEPPPAPGVATPSPPAATPIAPTPAAPAPTPTPAPVKLTPEEVRARERAVLLVAQTVMGAEKMYAASNHAWFDELRCLAAPWDCIPGFSADVAPFLDPTYDWLQPQLGYARRFHAGPRLTDDELRGANASPSSLKAFAFTLTPQRPGIGLRAFCGDSKGRLCVRDDGLDPPVRNGLCDPCKKLE